MLRKCGASSNPWRQVVCTNVRSGILDRPVKPGDPVWRGSASQTAEIILAAGLPEVCSRSRASELGRAQGKPDASRTRGLVCRFDRSAHKLQSPQDEPNIRLYLHDERYGLCRICPGGTSNPPVATRPSRDSPSGRTTLSSRSLTPYAAPASPGFAVRLLLRPSCTPGHDRIHTGLGVPPSRSSRRAQSSQRSS